MGYNIVRLVIAAIVGLTLILGVVKVREIKAFPKPVLVVAFLGYLLLFSLLFEIPFENSFLTFESPEAVLRYWDGGRAEAIIEGLDSSMVIYRRSQTLNSRIIPRSDSGYAIPGRKDTQIVLENFQAPHFWRVWRVNGTNDYYISGSLVPIGSTIEIARGADNLAEHDMVHVERSHFFFVYLHSLNEHDYFIINGERIRILD